jgi:hypothetical protein
LSLQLLGERDKHQPASRAVKRAPGSSQGPPRRGGLRALLVAIAAIVLLPTASLASTAPELSSHGHRLTWTTVQNEPTYRLLARTSSGSRISTVTGRSSTPPAQPGVTVTYRVRAADAGTWSNPVSIAYPEAERSQPPPPPPTSEMIVGLNAGGWGTSAWPDVSGAVKDVRLESRFATDAEVGAAAASGVRVDTWLFGTSGTIGKINPAAYAAEVVAVFKRYGVGGTFWQGRPDLGGRFVEVLNEPGGSWAWTDPTNYAAYTNLLKAVHEALAANFAPAIRPLVLASWDAPNRPFGLGWAALGSLAYCDGVTVHPYGGSNGESGGALGNRHSVEEAHALSGKPVYVTEIGWPTAVGQPPTGDSQQWTEAQQAQNITSFIHWARGTGYVAMVDVFGYIDYGSNYAYGIERKDHTHKLSYAALAAA